MPTPPLAVLQAIQAGTTRVTRRLEIYEADGVTPWQPGMLPRMIDGQVSVDYSRSDRRNLDVTLDNMDGLISHNPHGGFWYDKIIKVFRGIKWENVNKKPRVLLWDYDNDVRTIRFIQGLGFQADRYALTAAPDLDTVLGYDILLIIRQGSALDASQITFANLAFSLGISIFTMTPFSSAAIAPVGAVTNLGDSNGGSPKQFDQSTSSLSSPFAQVVPFSTMAPGAGSSTYSIPTGVAAGALAATTLSYTGPSIGTVNGFGLLFMQNVNSLSKWVHYGVPIYDDGSVSPTDGKWKRLNRVRNLLLNSAAYWLFAYQKDLEWECQIGEFIPSQINTPRHPKTIKVTGVDRQKQCLESTFDNAVSYDPGENVLGLIKDFAANSGITKFRMTDGASGTAETSTQFAFAAESPRWDAMSAVAVGSNLEIFFDAQGYLVTRPFFDPSTSAPTLTLKTGMPDGNLVDWSESSDDSLVYNRVVVSSTSTDAGITGAMYQGIAENHEPSSPTSIENFGRVKTKYYSSPFFTSNDQCKAYADAMLAVLALENFDMSYTSMVFAWLEAGEIIEILKEDTDPTDPTRFLNVNFTIPLTLDAMSGNAKRITIVG